jgi:hypothetical protein
MSERGRQDAQARAGKGEGAVGSSRGTGEELSRALSEASNSSGIAPLPGDVTIGTGRLPGAPDAPQPVKKKKKRKKDRFYKRFTYQTLRGYRPIMTPSQVIVFFALAGAYLIGVGVPILLATLDVVTYTVRYDDAGTLANFTSQERASLVTSGDGVEYSIDIFVENEMKAPVYVTYELGTFYQNYRRYVRSYDADQMHDGTPFPGLSNCEPFLYETASGLDPDDGLPEQGAILPCGQISHSNFNDSFLLSSSIPALDVSIDERGIAWRSDAEHLYGNVTAVNFNQIDAYRGGNTSTVPLNEDEHWMIWQRPAGQKTARKLYGRVNNDIPEGTTLTLTVFNRYNTYNFNGTKSVVLSTNSWMGGKNYVLPYIYLVCGGLCWIVVALFLGLVVSGAKGGCFGLQRVPGDTSRLSWVVKAKNEKIKDAAKKKNHSLNAS